MLGSLVVVTLGINDGTPLGSKMLDGSGEGGSDCLLVGEVLGFPLCVEDIVMLGMELGATGK